MSLKKRHEYSYNIQALSLFSDTKSNFCVKLLQRELFLTMFYTINSSPLLVTKKVNATNYFE